MCSCWEYELKKLRQAHIAHPPPRRSHRDSHANTRTLHTIFKGKLFIWGECDCPQLRCQVLNSSYKRHVRGRLKRSEKGGGVQIRLLKENDFSDLPNESEFILPWRCLQDLLKQNKRSLQFNNFALHCFCSPCKCNFCSIIVFCCVYL